MSHDMDMRIEGPRLRLLPILLVMAIGIAILAAGFALAWLVLIHFAPSLAELLVGPCEETLFRGLLLGVLEALSPSRVHFGTRSISTARIVIALLFALAHARSFAVEPWPLALVVGATAPRTRLREPGFRRVARENRARVSRDEVFEARDTASRCISENAGGGTSLFSETGARFCRRKTTFLEDEASFFEAKTT